MIPIVVLLGLLAGLVLYGRVWRFVPVIGFAWALLVGAVAGWTWAAVGVGVANAAAGAAAAVALRRLLGDRRLPFVHQH